MRAATCSLLSLLLACAAPPSRASPGHALVLVVPPPARPSAVLQVAAPTPMPVAVAPPVAPRCEDRRPPNPEPSCPPVDASLRIPVGAAARACARQREPRQRILCLRQSGDEGALPLLLAAGVQALQGRTEVASHERVDHDYAAELAGALAARTSPRILQLTLADQDARRRSWAARALGEMMHHLRLGLHRGEARDHAWMAGQAACIARTCLPLVRAPSALERLGAAHCLGWSADSRLAPALVQMVVEDPSFDNRHAAFYALERLAGPWGCELVPLAGLVAAPMPAAWRSDEPVLRGEICQLLGRTVTASHEWVVVAAREAVRQLGTVHSQASARCAALTQ